MPRQQKLQLREPDLAWEALVRETGANPHVERGDINQALKAIRSACDDEDIEDVPSEIERRAIEFRVYFGPRITMTPMALARHWFRVMTTPDEDSGKNLYSKWDERYGD